MKLVEIVKDIADFLVAINVSRVLFRSFQAGVGLMVNISY